MKKKTKYILITLIIILIVIASVVIIELQNPLRKSKEEIRESMLKLTPIGTSMDDVLKVIKDNEKWETMYVSFENGFSKPGSRNPCTIVGDKLVRVLAGRYIDFFKVSVSVYWGFDENSKLIDICVNKVSSSL